MDRNLFRVVSAPGSAPLDAASDRRSLIGVDLPPSEYGVDRRPDISGRHR
jgi:hypothetical protein